MKVTLKSGEIITVKKEKGEFLITPSKYQLDLSSCLEDGVLVAGTYPVKSNTWLAVREVLMMQLFTRQVESILMEDGEVIEELPYEDDVIY